MERIADYDYDLPEDLIAQTPLQDRVASRLLHLDRRSGEIVHRQFRDVVGLLHEGDLLVLNETRVSALRLFGRKPTGGAVEALLLSEVAPRTYEALIGSSKRVRLGTSIEFTADLRATVVSLGEGGKMHLKFEDVQGLSARINQAGFAPLPPYIHAPLADTERYQTVYGRQAGSAAAPTAGLHFTEEILRELDERGVRTARVTLHVGTDTFRPVKVEDPSEHVMTGEVCELPPETAEAVATTEGRIVAVGTTTVRTLESFATEPRRVQTGSMRSRLYIRPGFEFRIADGMFTNFHMPRTTMMMMISALAGRQEVMRAYDEAVRLRYRFLSFGDAMLIL